jgi:hypothetical protein
MCAPLPVCFELVPYLRSYRLRISSMPDHPPLSSSLSTLLLRHRGIGIEHRATYLILPLLAFTDN